MTQSVSSLAQLLDALTNAAEQRLQNTRGDELIVSPDVSAITEHLKATYDFEAPVPHARLFADVLTMLRTWDLDSTHPRYFGLFNPPALPITVAADALVAMFNPQVGTHTHAPGANQIEQHVLRFLSERIGFDASRAHAHFTSG